MSATPTVAVHSLLCPGILLGPAALWGSVLLRTYLAAAEVMQQKHGGSSSSIGPDIVKGEVLESLKKV